jgi:hypothetical protein
MDNAIPLQENTVVKFEIEMGSATLKRKAVIHRVNGPRKPRSGPTIVHIAMEELKKGDLVYIARTEITKDFIKYFYRRLILLEQDFKKGDRIR